MQAGFKLVPSKAKCAHAWIPMCVVFAPNFICCRHASRNEIEFKPSGLWLPSFVSNFQGDESLLRSILYPYVLSPANGHFGA